MAEPLDYHQMHQIWSDIARMLILTKFQWAAAVAVALASGLAAEAATLEQHFVAIDGVYNPGPYMLAPLPVQTEGGDWVWKFSIPQGERVVGASITGAWGTPTYPAGTAGVNVFVDDILVAKCEQSDPGCYVDAAGPRPWTHTFTESELQRFNDGEATLTYQQTSGFKVRLDKSTLIIETAVPPVPAVSSAGQAALLVALAAAGAIALGRSRKA